MEHVSVRNTLNKIHKDVSDQPSLRGRNLLLICGAYILVNTNYGVYRISKIQKQKHMATLALTSFDTEHQANDLLSFNS